MRAGDGLDQIHGEGLRGAAVLGGFSFDDADELVTALCDDLRVAVRRRRSSLDDQMRSAYRTIVCLAPLRARPTGGADDVIGAVRHLPSRQRELAQLCLYAGLSVEEAARVLKISVFNAKLHKDAAVSSLAGIGTSHHPQ